MGRRGYWRSHYRGIVLELPATVLDQIAAAAYDAYPYEACGLLAGTGDRVERFYRCRNAAGSARVYTVDPHDHLRAERDAEAAGWDIIGVVHSHTHSEPYPSPTDVAQAPDRSWHYTIVGLKRESPETRSYRIAGDSVVEEPITLV
jgi:[CysO sulfur-carrier protein]-S-L-cysteine hydrolase